MRREADLLMDAPETNAYLELMAYAVNKEYWRTRVRAIQQLRVTVEVNCTTHNL